MAITQVVSRRFPESEEEFYPRLCRVLNSIGTISHASFEDRRIKASVLYVINPVSVVVTWSSSLTVQGIEAEFTFSSGDEFGGSNRNAAKRVLETYLNMDKPGFEPNLIGISPPLLTAMLSAAMFLLVLFVALAGFGIIR